MYIMYNRADSTTTRRRARPPAPPSALGWAPTRRPVTRRQKRGRRSINDDRAAVSASCTSCMTVATMPKQLYARTRRFARCPPPPVPRRRGPDAALGANSRDRPRSAGRRDSIVEIILTVENIARVRFGTNLILSRERADGRGGARTVLI